MLNLFKTFNQSGGKKIKMATSGLSSGIVSLLLLVGLFINAFLVQWSYNKVMPKIYASMGGNPSTFYELTYFDSIVLIILMSSLF